MAQAKREQVKQEEPWHAKAAQQLRIPGVNNVTRTNEYVTLVAGSLTSRGALAGRDVNIRFNHDAQYRERQTESLIASLSMTRGGRVGMPTVTGHPTYRGFTAEQVRGTLNKPKPYAHVWIEPTLTGVRKPGIIFEVHLVDGRPVLNPLHPIDVEHLSAVTQLAGKLGTLLAKHAPHE